MNENKKNELIKLQSITQKEKCRTCLKYELELCEKKCIYK